MRKILILGAGAGGTIVANMLRRELKESEWQITIIEEMVVEAEAEMLRLKRLFVEAAGESSAGHP